MAQRNRNHLRLVIDNTKSSSNVDEPQNKRPTAQERIANVMGNPTGPLSLEQAAAREKVLTELKVKEELEVRLKALSQQYPEIDLSIPLNLQSPEHRSLIIGSFPHYFNGGTFVYWEDMDELISLEPNED